MTEKKKEPFTKDMTRIGLAVGVIVFAIAAGALGFLYSQEEGRYNALLSNYTKAAADIQTLQNDYNALNLNYSSLAAQYSSLQAQYQALQGNFTDLQAQYYLAIYENDLMNRIIELQEETTLEEGLTFTVYPDSDYPLVYMLDYAGYLVVEYSSTSSVYFSFSVDSFDYEITYPKAPSQSEQFAVPALPGANWVYVLNPDSAIPAAVTLTLRYVY